MATTVLSESATDGVGRCIVIDAGHGGVDGGATSYSGRLESHLNLEISLRLDALFRLLGIQTKMIRTEDISVYSEGNTIAQKKVSDLKNRVRIVNETDNVILLSIHQNYFTDSRYRGAQVFYAETNGSKELASQLQTSLVRFLNPGSTRKQKKGEGIYLLEHISTVGVLVECGFISNCEEDALLCQPDYQKKLACVIAASISQAMNVESLA